MRVTRKPEISVLIVNYKQNKDLVKTVEGVVNFLKGISYEILVFDNSSNLPKSGKYTIYKNGKNLGYSVAVNYLANNARGKYYLILNPDVVFNTPLFNVFSLFKKKAVEYGVLSLGKSEMLYKAPIINLVNRRKRFSSYAFLVYSDVFKSLGGFNVNYFMYFEDNEFALNLKDKGIKTHYPKILYVFHKKSYTNIPKLHRRYLYYKSLLVYLKQNYKIYYYLFFVPIKLAIIFSKRDVTK